MSNITKLYTKRRQIARDYLAKTANSLPLCQLSLKLAELVQNMDKNNFKRGK